MHHGTSVANARLIIASGFKQSDGGMLGKGVYVTRNIMKACQYPKKRKYSDRVVLQLHVRVGRVKCICKDKDPVKTTCSKQYDSAWVPPNCGMVGVPSGLQENCVFDPQKGDGGRHCKGGHPRHREGAFAPSGNQKSGRQCRSKSLPGV